MMFDKKGNDTNLRIYAPLWSIPILAIGVAETVAPYAEAETVGVSEASKSFNRIPIPVYPKAVTFNVSVRRPQPVSRGERASKKMASVILNDSVSAGAIKNVSAEIGKTIGGALPANTGNIPEIVQNNAEDSAEPKSAGFPPLNDDLIARSTSIDDLVEHNDAVGTTFSKSNFAEHQLASNETGRVDHQRMIYGTSARNADKAYFPQQFGQLAETLQGKSEVKFTSSIPEHGELDKNERNSPHQASDQAKPVTVSVDSDLSGTTVEPEELSIKGGYFHYGSSDVDSDVAFLADEDGDGKLVTTNASAESRVIPSEASSVPIFPDQSLEVGSAS